MTNLACLVAIIWVVTEKLKITSKQDYFSNITRLGQYLVDFDLRLDHPEFLELDAFSSRE